MYKVDALPIVNEFSAEFLLINLEPVDGSFRAIRNNHTPDLPS